MRLTDKTGVIVLGTIAAVLLGSGILSFVPGLNSYTTESPNSGYYSHVNQLLLGCRSYAADWEDGRFPASLADLYPDYIDIEDFHIAENMEGEKNSFIYHSGHSSSSHSQTPLIEYPFQINGKRIIGYTGGHVSVIREQ